MTRKEKQVTAGKHKVTIKEITPVEAIVIAESDGTSESMLDVVLATCDGLTEKIFVSLTQKDIDDLFVDFKAVNRAFFKDCTPKDEVRSTLRGDDAATPDEICQSVCRVIMSGHGPGTWNYGWRFFVTALGELDKARSYRLHDVAMAARASNLAEKDFKSFTSYLLS